MVNKVFDWLRFPLIVGVVFIHCFGKPFDYEALDFTQLSGMDCYNLFRVSISRVLTHVCVPTFYLISGYLFFVGLEKWNNNVYLRKLKKRCKSLLVPYLIWNSITLMLPITNAFIHGGMEGVIHFLESHNYWHLYWDCKKWNLDRTNWLGGVNLSSSPYLVPLWFLRNLMVVVLCSPALYYIFKKLKGWGVLLLSVCYISGVFICIPGFSANAFLFFGAGAFFKMNNIDMTILTYKYRYILYTMAFILWGVCTYFNGHNTPEGNYIYPFFVIVGCMALMNLSSSIVEKNILKMPNIFSKASFFIYLLHTVMVIKLVSKISYKIFGDTNPLLMTISYLFVPITTVIICLTTYYILNKFTPSLCKLLTGNR